MRQTTPGRVPLWDTSAANARLAASDRGSIWDEQATILSTDFGQIMGAAHVVDVDFAHGNFDRGPMARLYTEDNRESRERLSGAMMLYWAQFAHAGDPGRGRDGELPRWTPWSDRPGASWSKTPPMTSG